MPRLTALLVTSLAVTALAVPALTAPAVAADPLTVVDRVGLFQVTRDADRPALRILASDYDGGDERGLDPARALLHVPASAATTVPHDDFARDADGNPSEDPADSFYRFLGPEGTPYFATAPDPATGRAGGNLVLGNAGSSDVDNAHYAQLRLQRTTGPGDVHLFDDDPVADDPDAAPYRALHWDLSRPAGVDNLWADVFAPEDRAYATGAFAAPGDYCLQLRPELAPRKGGAPEHGDPVAVRVVVGDRSAAELAATAPCAQPDPETPTQPTDPDAPTVLGAGTHVDVAGVLRGGGPLGLVLRKTDAAGGGNEKLLPFTDTVVSVPDAARRSVPAPAPGRDTSFLGRPGDPTWRIPENQDRDLVWLGFGGETITDPVTSAPVLRVTGVTGADGGPPPGEVAVWNNNGLGAGTGPTFSTRQGLPQGAYLPVASHGHRNWDFGAPGVYCLGLDLQLANGSGVELRDAQQLTVVVGDAIDPASVTPCGRSGRALPLAVPARTPSPAPAGQTVELTSTPDGAVTATRNRLTTALRDGQLRTMLVRDALAGPGTAYDPDDVVFRARRDETGNYPFQTVGSGGGDTLGFDTLGLEAAQLAGRLDWRVTGVRGPGRVTVHDAFLDRTVLAASQATPTARTSLVPGRSENRFGLGLDTAGVYCVDMAWSGRRASDGVAVSDTATLTLVAGDQRGVTTCSRGQRPTAPASGGGSAPAPTQPGGGRPASGRTVLRLGHVDVRSDVTASGLAVRIHDDHATPAVDRDPARATFHAASAARTSVPADPAYRFLGARGAPVWVLPQTQDERLLWPGWNVSLGASATSVRWTLDSVRGPGRFALFENTAFGAPEVLLDSTRRGSSFTYAAHGHGNWAFGADGVYCLNSTFAARPAGGSRSVTLLVAVGNLDPATVTPADCGRTAAQVRALDAAAGRGPNQGGSGPNRGGAGFTPGRLPVTVPAATRPVAQPERCVATPVTRTRPGAATVVSAGHLDLGSRLRDGSLRAELEDGRSEPPVARDPASVVLDVGATARQRVPSGYGFLGTAGTPVWVIPQTQVAGVPWLGWNTQHPSLRVGVTGPVTFTLADVDGPGRLAVYTDDVFGGVKQRVFGTATGFPRSFAVPLNVHAHANWAFTAPGTYRLTITQTARLTGGGTRAATTALTVAVGQANPAAAAPTVRTVDYVGRTADGDACRLTAGQRARALASTGPDLADAFGTAGVLLGTAALFLLLGRRRRVR